MMKADVCHSEAHKDKVDQFLTYPKFIDSSDVQIFYPTISCFPFSPQDLFLLLLILACLNWLSCSQSGFIFLVCCFYWQLNLVPLFLWYERRQSSWCQSVTLHRRYNIPVTNIWLTFLLACYQLYISQWTAIKSCGLPDPCDNSGRGLRRNFSSGGKKEKKTKLWAKISTVM